MAEDVRELMPTRVKVALGIVWFQVVANAVSGVLLMVNASNLAEYGRDGGEVLSLFAFLSFAMAVALATAAVCAVRRSPRARNTILGAEALAVVIALITVAVGSPTAFISAILPIVVAMQLMSEAGRAWFGR